MLDRGGGREYTTAYLSPADLGSFTEANLVDSCVNEFLNFSPSKGRVRQYYRCL
jgi:hypothetical protein